MSIIVAKDITSLMEKATMQALAGPPVNPLYGANALNIHDVTLKAHSCNYQLDIGKELWLHKRRWTALVRQYVDRDRLERFVQLSQRILNGRERKGASAGMLFLDPTGHNKTHKAGGCLMGVVFYGRLGLATITLYSRTCFMGYIGLLDAAMAYALVSKEILTGISDTTPKDISFRWHIATMQVHTFKILPYIHSRPELLSKLKRLARKNTEQIKQEGIVWWNIVRWYKKMLQNHKLYDIDMLEQCKYGAWRRIQKRWLEYKNYLPRRIGSTPIETLDFGVL